MLQRLQAVFRDGVFLPKTPCDLPQDTEVELVVEATGAGRPIVVQPEEREKLLRKVTKSMEANPLPLGSLDISRDALHERR